MMDHTWKFATEIFYAALKAVDPYDAVQVHSRRIRTIYKGGHFKRLMVIGFGKAACIMVNALKDALGDLIDDVIVITKYGYCSSTPWDSGLESSVLIFEAGHPLPDENGLKATEEAIKLLRDADEDTLIVCSISGGGSALLVSPYEGISLKEKQQITELLLNAGADIYELNTVRKHISKVKGGRLAEIAYPAKVISLILSDVIGDRLDVIASGPTSPDSTTYNDALEVLKKYRLIDKAPQSIVETLQKGAKGLINETPKEGSNIFHNVENIIIGSNRIALDAAKKKAEESGVSTEIISYELTGEARKAGKWLAGIAMAKKLQRATGHGPGVSKEYNSTLQPICLISGGETTVTVKGRGMGGRNMELALSFAMAIEGIDGITLLSAGTDGTDGPTDAAGAIVDGETIKKARAIHIDPLEYLNNNDSYNFFRKIDALFITGPTGTNVMDIQIMVIE